MGVSDKRILVIDDDPDIRDVIGMVLKDEGFEISELGNGRDALSTIERVRPDVILLDVILGDIDGRDICNELKSKEGTKNIPIIMISATHGWHALNEKNCKADDYIGKPFDIIDLVQHVKQYSGLGGN